MSHKRIGRPLVAVIAFATLLPAQLGVSLLAGHEPYPTIRMPGFGDAPTAEGFFPTQLTRVSIEYEDGTNLTPHVADLMKDFRYSSSVPSFNYLFKDDSRWEAARPEVEPWLYSTVHALHPTSRPTTVSICWYRADVDVWTSEYVNSSECERRKIDL